MLSPEQAVVTLAAGDIGQRFADTVSAGPLVLAMLAAALAGLVSFASPCVIPLVPGYISYLAGVVGADTEFTEQGTKVANKKGRVGAAALLFVAGFTVIFLLATVTVFGLKISSFHQDIIEGAIILIGVVGTVMINRMISRKKV